MRHTLPALALIACLALSAVGQQIHVVDAASGPGSDYSDLQTALDAAASGDVLLMRAGSYSGASVTGKAVSVVADDDASVQIDGRLRIVGTPIGSTTSIKGLNITSPVGTQQPALQTKTCHGTLWVESCTLTGGAAVSNGGPAPGASVEGCNDAVFVRCVITGGSVGNNNGSGREGLFADDSDIWMFESDLVGANSNSSGSGSVGFSGASAAWIQDTALFATASAFKGGWGGDAEEDGNSGCGSAGDGGSGVRALNSTFTQQACTFAPGSSGFPVDPECGPGDPGQDVALFGSSSTRVLPGATRGLRMSAVVREGELAQFAAFGAAGELVWWIAGFDASSLDLPGKNSPLLLQLPILLSLPMANLPAGGVLIVDFPAPELPVGFDGVILRNQAFFAGTGNGQLSNAASTLFLDASL